MSPMMMPPQGGPPGMAGPAGPPGIPPQALQIMQTLGIDPRIMGTPQGPQVLALLLQLLQGGAPGAGGPPGTMPGGPPPGPPPQAMPMSMPQQNGGAAELRRTDPYAMAG